MIDIIRLNLLSIVVIAFFAVSGQVKLCVVAYTVALFHEAGHILAATLLNYRVNRIEILPVGVCASVDESLRNNPVHEFIVAASGPLVNLIGIVICIYAYRFFNINTQILTLVNLYMLIINLLPVLPLDGGRILNACLALEFKKKKADYISGVISVIMTVSVLVLGSVLLLNTGVNFSLVAAAFFLAGNLKTPDKNSGIVSIAENPLISACRVKSYVLNEKMTVLDAVREIDKKKICVIYISDSDGKVVHITTNKRIICAMSDGLYHEKIGDLFVERSLKLS